jgi:hypothetical protein
MKKILISLIFSLFLTQAFGQGGIWTWISGTNIHGDTAIYGVQGIPSVNNHPPGVYEASEWKDKQGNLWLYGGDTYAVLYSDLWKFNPLTNEWTWVKGNGLLNEPAKHGTMGVADPANTPGGRKWASETWTDTAGHLWLFGGFNSTHGDMNDLWKYDISTNIWTWISGDSVGAVSGVYGAQGVPSASNVPGSRTETSSAWTDEQNNLWLFGGNGTDGGGSHGFLNDLWKYDIASNEWTWMQGSSACNGLALYGTKGVASAINTPGPRISYTKWKDRKGNFYLMGGLRYNFFNDVWKYDLSSNSWTWMAGPSTEDDKGKYLQMCVSDTFDMPQSRFEHRSSVTDNCGRFWLFGGGNGSISNPSSLNDLWVFDPLSIEWKWIDGSSTSGMGSSYGSLGIPSPTNHPASRIGALSWWGNDNKFYLFGGGNLGGRFSDMWVFSPDSTCIYCNSSGIAPPVANFQASKTNICANDCIDLTDLSTKATSWQWTTVGGTPSFSTNQNPQVCYLTQGVYSVSLVVSNSGGSDTLSFTNYIYVKKTPVTPQVLDLPGIGNDTLVCSTNQGYISYQWYFNNSPIGGATDTFLVITQSGNYNVQVTNSVGCKTAVGINVVIGLQNYMNDNAVSLSPNPANSQVIIHSTSIPENETITISIMNVLGKAIALHKSKWRKDLPIDITNLVPGIYFVQLTRENPNSAWVGRFVKE